MHGESILCVSLSKSKTEDEFDNLWQYHSRSDRHSKIACWGVLFDLLSSCALLREHIANGKVGFGMNHEMTDFATGRNKCLDLVISVPRSSPGAFRRASFRELVTDYEIDLDSDQYQLLETLPSLMRKPVGDVLVAIEAKACMTAHSKAAPRLFDELASAARSINGSAQQAIATGLVLVNASSEFVSPDKNKRHLKGVGVVVNQAPQPRSVEKIIQTVRKLPVRGHTDERGYDALGVTTIVARNDGSKFALAPVPPALPGNDPLNYERMILRMAGLYASRFKTR